MNGMPSLVNEDDNKMLMSQTTLEEVKEATFQLNSDKALGPCGFIALVFQKCWRFMGKQIQGMMEE